MMIKAGDIVELPHYPTAWERFKALFGYVIPSYKKYRITSDVGPNEVAYLERLNG